MSRSSSLDTGLPRPIAYWDGDLTNSSNAAQTLQTAYLHAIFVPNYDVITALRVNFGAGGNGTYDVGIYDAGGAASGPNNLLVSRGATTTVTGIMTFTFATPLAVLPGVYWLAMWISNATDTILRYPLGTTNMLPAQSGTNATGLPALASSLTGLANTNKKMVIMALRQFGWS